MHTLLVGHPLPGVRWARRAYLYACKLHQNKPFDLVISRSISDAAHLPALAFVRRAGVPWIANWNDPPSYLFPPPYQLSASRSQRLVWRRYFREAAGLADFNTFPCTRLFQALRQELGLDTTDQQRVRIVPHLGLVNYTPPPRKEDEVFRLCHAGNLAAARNPENLLLALRRFVDKEPPGCPIELEILGVEEVGLVNMVAHLGLGGYIKIIGPCSYLQTLERLAASTVPVLVEAACPEGIFLPSKLVDYLQVRRPILAVSPKPGTLDDLVREHGGGLVADVRSVDEIEKALRTLYRAWCNKSLDSYFSQKFYDRFRPESVLDAFEGMLNELDVMQDRIGMRSQSVVRSHVPDGNFKAPKKKRSLIA
jgi:glycosyltransferase involved in cell wall biosynthesis